MVPQQQELICSLELECSRKFGNSKFYFYYPIQLDNFLITCWKIQHVSANSTIDSIPSNSFTKITSGNGNGNSGNAMQSNSSEHLLTSSNHNNGSMTDYPCTSDRYCCTIYEDGEIIQPTIDQRMKKFSWAKSFSKKKDFTKEELEILLSDIYSSTNINNPVFYQPQQPQPQHQSSSIFNKKK